MSETRTVSVGGNSIHAVIDGGEGRPWLTLLHALAANLHLWDGEAEALSRDYRVLRIDARGHGGSTADVPASTIADLATDVVAVWDALAIEKSHVLGLSLGGMTGLSLALDHKDRVERLIAADCRADAPDFFRAMWVERQALFRDKGMAAVAEITLPVWFSERTRAENPKVVEAARGWILGTTEGGYIGASNALKVLDLKRRLNEVRIPTLFVVGALDGPHPKEMREMAALVEGSRFEEIADAAHVANLEQPRRFIEIVRSFLKS